MDISEEMDYQYLPSNWGIYYKNAEEDFLRIASENSKVVKESVPHELDISYGSTPNQKLDIFGENALPSDAPVLIYIHGGYWRSGSRELASYPALSLYKAGIITVILGYELCPNVTVEEIVDEIKRAVTFVLKRYHSKESRNIFLCGHSVGGHLTMMISSSDVMQLEEAKQLKGFIPISGLFDLEPLLQTSPGHEVKITKDTVKTCSPMSLTDLTAKYLGSYGNVFVTAGDHDPPEFIRQSQDFERELKSRHVATKFLLMTAEDHFSIALKLFDPEYLLTKEIIKFITS